MADQNAKQLRTTLDHHHWVGKADLSACIHVSHRALCFTSQKHVAYVCQVYDYIQDNKSEDEFQSAGSESSRQRQSNMCER